MCMEKGAAYAVVAQTVYGNGKVHYFLRFKGSLPEPDKLEATADYYHSEHCTWE